MCQIILFGCSATPLPVTPCLVNPVPTSLLVHCAIPPFTVQHWGDYPDYVERLHLALAKCNLDKDAIATLLQIFNMPH
ncbi:hypothetical protein DBR09_17675 [Aeromonas sp. HMWF016]|nr:hypothetical protein DBR09_17675 [Aeromonas sp. HMWF016]